MTAKILSLILLHSVVAVVAAPKVAQPDPSETLFTNGAVTHLRIQLDAPALAALRVHQRSYVKATVTEGQTVYRDVGLHLKGQYGTFQSVDGKPSLTLNFHKFVPGQRFHGLAKLHLNNSGQDPTYLNELVGRDLFRRAGLPVGRAGHARMEFNGRDLGLFVLVEGYDKTFLRRHFADPGGNLYDSEFMHDITEPIKKGSGDGPADHSDLKALAAAAEEPDPAARLKRLAALLDLDRFYSFLAVELMARHYDGYAVSKNNYWLYHDPAARKMVFIPHGMDQMFYQPESSLFPDLQGVLARAVLEAPQGRVAFRERCAQLYSNLFPQLTNRVAAMQSALRPVVAVLGTNALHQQTNAVAALQQRITQRTAHLRKHLFDSPPLSLTLAPDQQVPLTNWMANLERGQGRLFERTNSAGGRVLHCQFEGGGEPATAVWQSTVLLPRGQYAVFASVFSEQPVFKGPKSPVSLRVWGLSEVQLDSRVQDATHTDLLCVFLVSSEVPEQMVIQCEVHGSGGMSKYRLEGLTLAKVK